MFRFVAGSEGHNKFGFSQKLQAYADGFGVPAHVDAETAAAIVLDAFKRKVRGEMELLELECVKTEP